MKQFKNNTKPGKAYILGIILICSFLFVSTDECESDSMAEQERYYREQQAARSEQERARSGSQNQQPATAQPGTQTTQPGTQTTQPGTQTAQPGTQTAQPGTQTTQPGTQTAQPGTQTAQPGTQTAQPGTQTAQPGTQTTQPGTQTAQPAQVAVAGATPSGTQGISGATPQGTEAAQTGSSGADHLRTITGKEWRLVELRFSERTVILNRNELSSDMRDILTMNIDNNRVSGRGAPNRYFTSYRAEANNALTFQPIASTLMATIFFEPQRIREEEYFQYLSRVTRWNLNRNRLELFSTEANGRELVMVFAD